MEEEFKRLELKHQWEQLHEILNEKSRVHSFGVADSEKNKDLNRYIDVKPYEKSRVKLNRSKNTDYINANLVTVPKAARQYILTQGPLPKTLGHFWLMTWEQKSNVIVMLNRVVEDFVDKCEQYWPDSVGQTNHYKEVKLDVTLVKTQRTKHYIIREMKLHDEESNKSRMVLQFHYTVWPDHGEPDSPTSILRLLAAIRKSGGLDKMDEPTIVHCSAGIGRSGTFCLIDSILSMVESQGSTEGIDILNTLIEMRDYRWGLIQKDVQLRFAYMSIIYGIKVLENANKLHPHISSSNVNTVDATNQQQRMNGSNNGKKHRRNRKKQNSSNSSSSLNIFNKHLLVEALDEVDSDSADTLYNDMLKPWPNMKKPRNSSPDTLYNDTSNGEKNSNFGTNGRQSNSSDHPQTPAANAQMLASAINSFFMDNKISSNNATSVNSLSSASASQNSDSVLARRRDRDQRLAEKTQEIRNKMKAEELKRERSAKRLVFFKKSAVVGGLVAIALSSIVYVYMSGSNSS